MALYVGGKKYVRRPTTKSTIRVSPGGRVTYSSGPGVPTKGTQLKEQDPAPTRQEIAEKQGSEEFKKLAEEKLTEKEKESRAGSEIKQQEQVRRQETTKQIIASKQQEQRRTKEQERVLQEGRELQARQAKTSERVERGKNIYRAIPGLKGDNRFQRGAREFLFIINPGTSAPALGETLAAGVDSAKYIRNYRRVFGTETTPTNTQIATETGRQTINVVTFRNPQTGEFTAESVGATSALIVGGALGARGSRSTGQTTPTPAKTAPPRVRTVSIFEEAGVPRATGDLPPGISFTETAPRGVALSAKQAQQGVPLEFTYESIGGKTQFQTRLAKGGDPARTVSEQIVAERYGGIQQTERFVFDTAGRDPRQTTLGARERGVRTESGAFIDRIPTSEQVIVASNLKRGGNQGRQTVLDSFVDTPKRTPTAQEIIDASTPTTRNFLKISGRKAQLGITRQQPRARPNPNKLPFGLPGKGQLGEAKPSGPTLNNPTQTTGSPRLITTFIGQNQRTTTTEITVTKIQTGIDFDQDFRPTQQQSPILKPDVTPIESTTPIVRPRSRGRSRSRQQTAQTPIQDTLPIQEQTTPPKTQQKNPLRIPTRSPPTPKTPRDIPPVLPLVRVRKQPQSRPSLPGYDVFVRRRGKYVLVSDQPLPKAQAVQLGAVKVGTSAAATFKIRPSGRKATGTFAGRGKISDFYRKTADTFIEKASRRIKSAGELTEITYKGIAASKGKKRKNPLTAFKIKLPRITL